MVPSMNNVLKHSLTSLYGTLTGLFIANAAIAEEPSAQAPDMPPIEQPYYFEGFTEHATIVMHQASGKNAERLGANAYSIFCNSPELTALTGAEAHIILSSIDKDGFRKLFTQLAEENPDFTSQSVPGSVEIGIITPDGQLKTDLTPMAIAELYAQKADGRLGLEGTQPSDPNLQKKLDAEAVKLCMGYS